MEVSELVTKTIATGVSPIEFSYRAVRSCSTYNVVAYSGSVSVNSVQLGHITPSDYQPTSENHDVGVRLCLWAIERAIESIQAFKKGGRHPKWISVFCPVAFAESPDFYERIKKATSKYDQTGSTKLCFEFSEKLLLASDAVRQAVLDLKILGIQSMVVCEDIGSCPFFKLADIPVDFILLAPQMAELSTDRNKPGVFSALVQYIDSMGIGVLVNKVKEETDRLNIFNRLDCVGYLSATEKEVTLEEAVLQKEDEDEWRNSQIPY